MRDGRSTPVTCRVHPSRPGVVVALLGVAAVVLGFLAPATAAPSRDTVVHKSYVCKYVGTPGVHERLQGGDNPIYVDNHSVAGKDVVEVGDLFTDAHGFSRVIVANTVRLDPEPGIESCPGYAPPTTTTTQPTTTTTQPTTTTTQPSTTTTTEPPTTTTTQPPTTTTAEPSTTTTTQPTTETPETGATVPSSTTKPVVTGQTPDKGATAAPSTPQAPTQPEVGAVHENAVPQAHTDGADLVGSSGGWTGLQSTLVGAGLLMVAAGGLMSVRREQADR